MARLVIAAAGAAAGFAIGGIEGARIGWTVGSVVGAGFGPKQKSAGPRLDDRRVTGSDYGTVIPYVEGSPRQAGIIIYASEKRETATTTSQGKGGGGAEYTNYTYDVDLMYILSENPITGVYQVFINGDLVFDGATLRNGVWDDFRIYTGDDAQLPDPTYEAAVGTADALAYTRRGTVFIQGLKLGTSGQIPNITFVIGNSGDMDELTYLLSLFAGGSTDDVSTYEHGSATTSGTVTVTDGNLQLDYSASLSASAQFYNADYASISTVECTTYEWLFVPTGPVGQNAASPIVILLPGSNSWTVSFTGFKFLEIIPGTGGTGAASYYTSNPTSINGVSCHLAFQIYNDGTVSIFFNGNRIKNRVVSNVSYPPAGTIGFQLGGNRSGLLDATTIDFSAVRITRAEIYTEATYVQPTTLGLISIETPGSLATAEVDDVVTRLMTRSGYAADEFDVTDLASITRPVRSLMLTQIGPTSTAIDVLASGYFFEYYTADKIYFRNRGGVSAATIPYDDLRVEADRESDSEPFPFVLGNELEVPARVLLSYSNVNNDAQRGMESSDRLLSSQVSDNAVELPIGLTPDEAKAVASVMLLDQVAELPRVTISLGIEYSALRPTDVVNLTGRDGTVYRMRIVTRKDTGGVFEMELVGDDSTVLLPVGGTDNNYVAQNVLQIAATEWVLINGPIGRDDDNNRGYYIAAKPGEGDLWPGAVALESFDGATYSESATIVNRATFGVCTTTLPDFTDGFVFDEISTLTVNVSSGTLSSSTRAAMLNDQAVNAAAVGSPTNGWEYLQFRTATLQSPGIYVLTGFLRGRRGTEQYTNTHVAAEYFVVLDQNTIRRTAASNSEIGVSRSVKVVTTGLPISSVTAETFTNTGVGLKPFAPANPTALKDGSDLIVSAQRRTRMETRYGGIPGTSVPLGETIELYRLRVYSGSTLKRTVSFSSLPYTYAAADITADGFTTGNTITFTLCQVSDAVGDGTIITFTGIAP